MSHHDNEFLISSLQLIPYAATWMMLQLWPGLWVFIQLNYPQTNLILGAAPSKRLQEGSESVLNHLV